MSTDTQLDTLEAKGLVRLAAYRPELEYLFRHWLVQDAAYGSLLKQERRELHRLVGEALEALYAERRQELAAVLGMHFEQAGETEKAIEYLAAAGDDALDRNALAEAYSAFDRAARLLPPVAESDDEALRRRRIKLEIGRTRASWTFRPLSEVVDDLERVLPEVERLGDLDLIARMHLYIALTRLQRGDKASDPAVRRSLDRATEIGEQIGDPSLRAMPLAVVGMIQILTGSLRDGVAALEEALPLLQMRHELIGAAFTGGILAIGYGNLGEFDKAERALKNARELAASGDAIAQIDAEIADAIVQSARGELEQVMPLAMSCLQRSEEVGASACILPSAWVLGDAYLRQGRFADAREVLKRGNELSLIVDRKGWRPTLQAWLLSAATALGESDSGTWDEALDMARSIGNRIGEAGILWKRAEVASRRGAFDDALPDLAKAAEILEAAGARPTLARVLRAWGEALRKTGRRAEGDATLQRALALFTEMGIAREAEEVRQRLSEPAP